jgi:peptidoglycan/LPS O-acetylase OafA/YrhL
MSAVSTTPAAGAARPTGHLPGLDGLRAISVIAVLIYHAGFSWLHGGFLGVEVFFVVSGYLITALLMSEVAGSGTVSLRGFWLRRARRLLPALVMVLIAVTVGAALFGSAQVQSDVKRDLPWAVFYAANWGQIVGDAAYFANLSPFRHLWSLAVEEQWYLVWPLIVLGLVARRGRPLGRTAGTAMIGAGVAVMVLTTWMARAPELGSERIDLLYLSTFTRSSGLLLGAGAAVLWSPWRVSSHPVAPGRRWTVDIAGIVALAWLADAMVRATITDRGLYRWQLASVSIASLVVVLAVVHPASVYVRSLLSTRPLVEIGKRSYGVYLWSWPISVAVGAYTGSWPRFIIAMALTAVVSELSYRLVETPIRQGRLGQWWKMQRVFDGRRHLGDGARKRPIVAGGVVAVTAVVAVPTAAFYASVQPANLMAGGAEVEFVLPSNAAVPASSTAAAASSTAEPAPTDLASTAALEVTTTVPATTTTVAPTTTLPRLPRRVVIVGDSTAHALAINLPSGIDETFDISDGGVDGCSVYGDGKVKSARNFGRTFADCGTATDQWVGDAQRSDADVALVVLGAWDVFDHEVDGVYIAFGSPESDARFVDGLQRGIDGLVAAGTQVALLEIPCMRPVDVEGAGVPALPERGDDARVAHLNDLLRGLAAAQPEHVTFVPGPTQWCNDEAVSTDLGMRWDGVHVYKPGAKLVFETIAPTLLAIPVPPAV